MAGGSLARLRSGTKVIPPWPISANSGFLFFRFQATSMAPENA